MGGQVTVRDVPTPHTPSSLGRRAATGGLWLIGLRIASRSLGFLRSIILARILTPADFGVFGLAMLAMNTLGSFAETGVQAALIQRKGSIDDYLSSAWTIHFVRSLFIASLLFWGAPLAGTLLASPVAVPFIRAMALSQVIGGFFNIGFTHYQREIRFDVTFIHDLASSAANLSVSLFLAWKYHSPWALVAGTIAQSAVSVAISHIISPTRPVFEFDLKKVGELLSYGRWLLVSNILMFLVTQGDDAFVGRMLGVAALGYYQMAYNIACIPSTEIANMVSRIAFPVFAKIQTDLARLNRAYLNTLRIVSFLSFPIAGCTFVFAQAGVEVFLGKQWASAIIPVRILAVWGVVRAVATTTSQVFRAIGKPRTIARLRSLEVVLLAAAIYPLSIRWGIRGTSLAVVCATIVPIAIACGTTIHELRGKLSDFLWAIAIPAVSTLTMSIATWLLCSQFPVRLQLVVGPFIAAVVYVSCVAALARIPGWRFGDFAGRSIF